MTKRELLSLAFKFAGIVNALYSIYFFLTTIRDWNWMAGFKDFNFSAFWAGNITSTLLHLMFSLALVLWGDRLARWLVPADAALLPLDNPLPEKALLDSVVKFLGVLWLCKSIPDFLTTTSLITFHWNTFKNHTETMIDLGYPAERIVIGIALLVLGHYLVEYAFRGSKDKVSVG